MKKLHIKKDDIVEVLSGSYKGTQAKVLRVYPKKDRVLVEGVNMVKRHVKPDADNTRGGIIEKEASIHVSNLLVVDPSTKRGERIGRKMNSNNKLVRYFVGSGNEVR